MKLIELYEHILNYSGVYADPDGTTKIVLEGNVQPCLVNEKQLMLPHDFVLKKPPENIIVFHPFNEYVNRGESDIVRKLRRMINIRINLGIMTLADKLLQLLESASDHKHLSPQQRELVTSVKGKFKPASGESELRAKLASFATKIFVETPDSVFLNIYLKKSGTFKGEKHARVGVVSFPFYEALADYNGFTKDQKETILSLFEFIFPGSKDDAESYNGYSDSMGCPWLDCLLKTSYNMVSRMTELTSLYKDFIEKMNEEGIPSSLIFDREWVDEMDNLEKYQKEILLIPTQAGNEGIVEKPVIASPVAASAMAAANAPVRTQVPATPSPVQSSPQGNTTTPIPYASPADRFVQPIQQPMPHQAQVQQPAVTADGMLDLSKMLPGAQALYANQMGYPAMTGAVPSLGVLVAPNPIQQQQEAMYLNNLAATNPAMFQAVMAQRGMQSQQPMMQQQMMPQVPYYPPQQAPMMGGVPYYPQQQQRQQQFIQTPAGIMPV